MLLHLHVNNLAIVDELRTEFAPGMNVITGETGAGKSVLIGALELALGGKAERDMIRAGADTGRVEAVFALENPAAVQEILAASGLPPCEEGTLVLRRSLNASGPGRSSINDAPATLPTLRRLGERLVDMHGPHDRQSLLDPSFQRDLLDDFGRHGDLLAVCRERSEELRTLREHLQTLSADPEALRRRADLLRYQIEEIEAAELTSEDDETLEQAHAEAANAEFLISSGSEAVQALDESDDSAFSVLARVQRTLEEMSRRFPEAEEWLEEAKSAAIQVQGLSRNIADRIQRIEIDPGQLTRLEERMALVQKLKRKYGRTIVDILEFLAESRRQLEEIDDRDRRLADIEEQIDQKQRALEEAGRALSARRANAGRTLAEKITKTLRELGFHRSEFTIALHPSAPGPHGADIVDFGFAPNPGEPLRSLKAIASSGEISRVMLAVKSVLAAHDRIPVLVFDEIDANIGGVTADVVGKRMRAIAASHQVLCITHLPQVAAYGARHLVVRKRFAANRTRVAIDIVGEDDRDVELARMLGGRDITPAVMDHARALRRRCSERSSAKS